MQRPLGLFVAAAALAFTTAAYASPSGSEPAPTPAVDDDGGVEDDGGVTPVEDASTTSNDASAVIGDMAHRPGAAKASLPGCSMDGGHTAPIGSVIVAGALIAFSIRPRRSRVRVRRTTRHRR